jgi:short-subunit dehydrogenase
VCDQTGPVQNRGATPTKDSSSVRSRQPQLSPHEDGAATDLRDLNAVEQLIRVLREVGILVSNAGPTGSRPFFEITEDDLERLVRLYLLAPVRLARHFAKRMVDRGWGACCSMRTS